MGNRVRAGATVTTPVRGSVVRLGAAAETPGMLALGLLALGLLAAATGGCGTDETFTSVDREVGERAPRTGRCDDSDPTRCHLPWPSSRFLVADESTETGVRQSLDADTYIAGDDAAVLEQADGFSRISPLLVGTSSVLGPLEDSAVHLFVAEPGHPDYGTEVPVRVVVEVDEDLGESFVVAYPRRPMPENAAHVAVAMRSEGLEPTDAVRAALGLKEPTSQDEADLRGYHAPSRALLTEAGIDLSSVARVWDFVTRSDKQVREPLLAMREATLAALDAGVAMAIDSVEVAPKPSIAVVFEGTIEMPWFVTDELPDLDQNETHTSRFRVLVPAGSGDYALALFGHGMGGSYDDSNFDEAFAEEGFGKAAVDFHGWTIDTQIITMGGFAKPYIGTAHGTGYLMQSLAEMSAVHRALEGPLADLLSAEMVNGEPNPAAGRRPDLKNAIMTGGSMGGTMGYAYANLEPSVRYAALNVGGAGWSHYLPPSAFFAPLSALMRLDYGSRLDVTLVVAQTQTNWDYADGGVWVDHREVPPVLLIQESIDDPVLPNIGTELMAVGSGAVRVGVAIVPFGDLPVVEMAVEQTAVTQFKVTGDATFVHGFAATETPGGDAAREQIRHFLTTARTGRAEIVAPSLCGGLPCDFSE